MAVSLVQLLPSLMANKEVICSDRIVGLSVQNGLVRIDLAAITGRAKTKEGKDGIKLEVTHQLVIPLDGFVDGFNSQQKMMQELMARQQSRAQATVAPTEPAASASV